MLTALKRFQFYFYLRTKVHLIGPVLMMPERLISLTKADIHVHFGHVRVSTTPYILNYIYVRFGTKLYSQIDGIPIGTNCAPLVTDIKFILLRKGVHGFSIRRQSS